jgi:hypothetical protein
VCVCVCVCLCFSLSLCVYVGLRSCSTDTVTHTHTHKHTHTLAHTCVCVCVCVCVCRLEELLNRHGADFESSSLSQVHQYLISYASSRSKVAGNISSAPSTVAEYLSGNSLQGTCSVCILLLICHTSCTSVRQLTSRYV